MKYFTQHLHDQGISYFQHADFALGIAFRLGASVLVFALHGLFPWIGINRRLDLEATSAYLLQQNDWIESASIVELDLEPINLD
ncbi:MAG: hypothetical protein B6D77_17200 [gamma proteobacterium symbiont of Ctena orbiculata]|nr:MAG: hypothetical protein B6D77_17200 [gamma proteobacterium symbiont of Ctena orbiculata]PVV17425.1 MAG: hypothetical protein B6D78_18760 [gamma proteobacterium symbiont of Ctena orbiculata]